MNHHWIPLKPEGTPLRRPRIETPLHNSWMTRWSTFGGSSCRMPSRKMKEAVTEARQAFGAWSGVIHYYIYIMDMQMSMNMCIYVYNIYVYSCDIHICDMHVWNYTHVYCLFYAHVHAHVYTFDICLHLYSCGIISLANLYIYLPVYRSISAVTPLLDD